MRNMLRIAGAVGLVAVAAACTDTSRNRPSVAGVAAGPKHIASDGAGGLRLPDGTSVRTDRTGGFRLPNGDYVSRDRSGALQLPNGTRCVPDGREGYDCP